jgi:hypothetical protein
MQIHDVKNMHCIFKEIKQGYGYVFLGFKSFISLSNVHQMFSKLLWKLIIHFRKQVTCVEPLFYFLHELNWILIFKCP